MKEAVTMPVQSIDRERILVCVSASPTSSDVIRRAAKLSESLGAELIALYVENSEIQNDAQEKAVHEHLDMAQRLGAVITTIYGNDPATAIAQYARVSGITKIVLGKSPSRKHAFAARETLMSRLNELAPDVEIMIVPNRLKEDTGHFSIKRILQREPFTAGDLLHFAEYIALNFPLLQSNPRHPYRKAGEIDAVVRRLYKEAVCCGAAEAMKLLQQYCFGAQQEDSFCELYYQQISPFEADYLLSLTSDACAVKDGYQGEAQLHRNGSEEYAPAEFFRVITALMYKSDILGWLRQYRSADRYKNDRAVETALKELDVNDLAEFGARNNSKWIFNVLCSCGDETLLTLLCRKTIEQAKSDEE